MALVESGQDTLGLFVWEERSESGAGVIIAGIAPPAEGFQRLAGDAVEDAGAQGIAPDVFCGNWITTHSFRRRAAKSPSLQWGGAEPGLTRLGAASALEV